MKKLGEKKRVENFVAKFPIGSLVEFKVFKKGFANRLFYLKTTKGKFVLKIAVRNNPYRVNYEVELLNFLKALPTPKLQASFRGNYLENFGQNKALVYTYLPGRQKNGFNRKMLNNVGQFLAMLHLQSRHFESKVKRLEFYNITKPEFKNMVSVCRRIKNKKIQEAISYVERHMPRYELPKKLPVGGMHIDFKPENSLFVGSKLTGVVDFDNSYNGPLLLDLGKTIMWFCSQKGKFNLTSAKIIYRSYSKIRKLSRLEKACVNSAVHLAFLNHLLVDSYYFAKKQMGLPKSYIIWQIDNLLKAEKALRQPI